MRKVPCLEPIAIRKLDGSLVNENAPPVQMHEFVFGLLQDPKATVTFAAICKSLRVRDAFAKPQGEPGQVLCFRIEQADWEHLCTLAREPTGGYAAAAYSMKPFIEAICDAKEE